MKLIPKPSVLEQKLPTQSGTGISEKEQLATAVGKELHRLGFTLFPVGPGYYVRHTPATCMVKQNGHDGEWGVEFRRAPHSTIYVADTPSSRQTVLDELSQIFDY